MLRAPIKSPGSPRVLALLFLALLALSRASSAPQPSANAVHAEGCVEAGIESRCLILRDFKTGRVYDLLFKAERPPVGLGIEFSGVLHPGPSACMQGIAVDVTTWARKASIKCVPGQAGQHSRPTM